MGKKILTKKIQTAYVNNNAHFIHQQPTSGMTIEEHVRLLMHELIDEMVEDGYLIKAGTHGTEEENNMASQGAP